MKTTKSQKQGIRNLVKTYFKDRVGKPFNLTDGQCDIFAAVVNQDLTWVWTSAPTRYGKSEVLALALIYLAVFIKLKIPVVAGSSEKARKIMDYVLQHLPDHPDLYKGLLNIKGVKEVEKLKVSASKDALRWVQGGWIYITSIDSRSIVKEGEGVVGEGGDVVVLEEAGLIKSKEQFSKIVRMPEGEWKKLVMSGNCIERSVFEDAFKNPLYVKVRIGLNQALKEGRYTQQELNDKKSQTTTKDWKRYYEVEFPEGSQFNYFKPKVYGVLPPIKEYYGAVDLALGETGKGSLVGINVIGKDEKGQFYQIESIGEHMTPNDTMTAIFNLQYKFNRFGIEAVQFQKYFLTQIEEKSKEIGRYIPFEGIQQNRQKVERIESLEPTINTGQILFRGNDILWEHMSDYPSCPLDVLDSLEMATRIAGLTSGRVGFSFQGF